MPRRTLRGLPSALLVVLLLSHSVFACCPAAPPGVSVNIADQEILVVWDESTGIEHFVRRANFATEASNFGFLVPTPSVPELAEESDGIFYKLADLTRPRTVVENQYRIGAPALLLVPLWRITRDAAVTSEARLSGSVTVLLEARVAGHDAVVLEADDPHALAQWLRDHGYATRPALAEWLEPYVANKWKITAFRHAADEGSKKVATTAIRMSFKTERPVFPYRVPTDQLSKVTGGGLLRTYFVGSERVEGVLGAEASPWPASTEYAAPDERLGGVLDKLMPSNSAQEPAWLTVFDDPGWPGGTEDLFFIPARDKSPIVPEPLVRYNTVEIPIPTELGLLIGFLWWRGRRAKKRA